MPDIKSDNLIKRELEIREKYKERLNPSIIEAYFLTYEKNRDEIIPVRHYDGCVMSKADVRTIIKGLTNYVYNHFTDDEITEYNQKRIDENERRLYGDSYRKPKTPRDTMSGSSVREGLVYFIKEEFSGTIKIGKTRDLKSRSEQFSVKLPFEWNYIKVINSKDYSLTESLFHKKFENKRVNGEWFKLSESDVTKILNEDFEDLIKQSISGKGEIYE